MNTSDLPSPIEISISRNGPSAVHMPEHTADVSDEAVASPTPQSDQPVLNLRSVNVDTETISAPNRAGNVSAVSGGLTGVVASSDNSGEPDAGNITAPTADVDDPDCSWAFAV